MNSRPLLSFLIILLCCINLVGFSQSNAGSVTNFNSSLVVNVGDTLEINTESLYFGPLAQVSINGTMIVYSSNVWIANTAVIGGNGTLIIQDPSLNPDFTVSADATSIDGNDGLPVNVAISLLNPNNLVLTDILDPGFGTDNPLGVQAATLNLNAPFNFDIDNGDIVLNGFDVRLGENGSLSNYGPQRMVISGNSVFGHLSKNHTANQTVVYPIGISEGDYTPIAITGSGTYHVSVVDYANVDPAVIMFDPTQGMNRMWHVYGDLCSKIMTVHNSPSTDGTSFIDVNSFVSRYLGGGTWSNDATSNFIAQGVLENTNDFVTSHIPPIASTNGAWITKRMQTNYMNISACVGNQSAILDVASCLATVADFTNHSDLSFSFTCSTGDNSCLQVSQNPVAGSTITANQLVWILAQNDQGDKDSCSFWLNIQDTLAPVITACVPNQVLSPQDDCKFVLPSYIQGHGFAFQAECNSGENHIVSQIPVAGTPIFDETTVWLKVTDLSGNSDSCSFQVAVVSCDILISESFSPNGDGKNDFFTISNLGLHPNTKVSILNRWGVKVYESSDYKNDWDGKSTSGLTIGDEILPEGVYYYIVELGNVIEGSGVESLFKGTVYLKR